MMLISGFEKQTISTLILIAVVLVVRYIAASLVRKYSVVSQVLENRANLIIKYISVFMTAVTGIALFLIWGVDAQNIFATVTGIMTLIGVALFAQWSVLSNITSGIILLFSFPFKIGDSISIHDKDFPIEGEIMDIRAFYTLMRTSAGEIISYPNNLLLQKGVTIVKPPHQPVEFTD